MKTPETVWRDKFLCMALFYSTFSKDPSTKVGCVITDTLNKPVGFGTNGFSRMYHDSEHVFNDRSEKYKRVLHAEENAIFNATGSTLGTIAYLTHPPCLHCCHVLSQNGIFKVVAIKPTGEFSERWNLEETANELKELDMVFESVEEPSSDSIIQTLDQWQRIVKG